MSISDEIEKLQRLKESGAISEDEFAQAKVKILQPVLSGNFAWTGTSGSVEQQTRQWAMFLHFSILAGFVVPVGGLAVPILIWQLKKDELPEIDAHGKAAVNWIISKLIYAAVSVILAFVVIGIPMLIALGIASVVFPIMAGIKAGEGKLWKYPMSLTFFK